MSDCKCGSQDCKKCFRVTKSKKCAGYAKAESPIAKQLGFGDTGCFYTCTYECLGDLFSYSGSRDMVGYATEYEARKAFADMPYEVLRSLSVFA
jgi:hypothetical protein